VSGWFFWRLYRFLHSSMKISKLVMNAGFRNDSLGNPQYCLSPRPGELSGLFVVPSNAKLNWFLFLGLFVGAGLVMVPKSWGSDYAIADLGDLGGDFSRAYGVNDHGFVVGDALLPVSGIVRRAILWGGGTVTDLGTAGGQQSYASGINNSGTICGWAQGAAGNALPALWSGSSITALPTLGGAFGQALAINDSGSAVGHASLSSGRAHAALWSGGQVHDLGTLGGASSQAYDINNQGIVVGTATDSLGRVRATLWGDSGAVDLGDLSGGEWTAIRGINDLGEMILWGKPQGVEENRAVFWNGDPASSIIDLGSGGLESWAYGLNDAGYVVGWEEISVDGPYRAFVWDGVEKQDLGTLGGIGSAAYGINADGTIVGYAIDEFSATRAVQWIPVPEPSTLALGLLGAAGWVLRRRRRRTTPV
jgi:probable HAF family extracellular repeat protein